VSRDAKALDSFVEKALILRLSRPDLLALASAMEAPDLEELDARLKAEESELQSWRRLAKERKVTAVAFAEVEPQILGRIAEIKEEIAAAVRTPILAEVVEEIRGLGTVGFDEVYAFWKAKRKVDLFWCRSVLQALVTVTVVPAPSGRPAGWRHGDSYFNPDYVKLDWARPGSAR